jgi:regulator of replication initiation timing
MADDVNQRVEDMFKILVSITEKIGNFRKDMKKDILESVSTLRREFSQLILQLENINEEHKKLREEVKNATEEMARRRDSQSVRQVAPSLDHLQQYPHGRARQVLPSEGG